MCPLIVCGVRRTDPVYSLAKIRREPQPRNPIEESENIPPHNLRSRLEPDLDARHGAGARPRRNDADSGGHGEHGGVFPLLPLCGPRLSQSGLLGRHRPPYGQLAGCTVLREFLDLRRREADHTFWKELRDRSTMVVERSGAFAIYPVASKPVRGQLRHRNPGGHVDYRASRWGSGVESFTTTGMATGLRCACRQAMRRDHI